MFRFSFLFALLSLLGIHALAQSPPAHQVMIVGFDHLSQLYNQQPSSDVYSPKKQAELGQLIRCLQAYAPDMILVEAEPSEQTRLDSLFSLYSAGKLALNQLKDGRSETYQIGFALAKRLGHSRVLGVDHYEATSQSLLAAGENIDVFKQALQQFQGIARPLKKRVQQDSLSIYDYIRQINQPALIALSHRLFFNLPAQVINGEFSQSATNTVDVSAIDKRYIGAEFISLFYNRNLKIYSNALTAQRHYQGKKLLLIFGQQHAGVLQELYQTNPDYTVVPFRQYCPD